MKGPVYGAKTCLWSYGPATSGSSGATTAAFAGTNVNSNRTVPPYEDWLITEFWAACSTCSSQSNALILKTEGGTTTINPNLEAPGNGSTRAATLATLNNTPTTSTSFSTWATVSGDAAEYEGAWVPAGSSLRVVSSGSTPMGGVTWSVMGYIRFRSSTRAE
jgi:hypothetical protein